MVRHGMLYCNSESRLSSVYRFLRGDTALGDANSSTGPSSGSRDALMGVPFYLLRPEDIEAAVQQVCDEDA